MVFNVHQQNDSCALLKSLSMVKLQYVQIKIFDPPKTAMDSTALAIFFACIVFRYFVKDSSEF
jgi:hypothetical protein